MRAAHLDYDEVIALTQTAKRTLQIAMKAGTFPKPDCRVNRSAMWKREAVEDWLAKQYASTAEVAPEPETPLPITTSESGENSTIEFASDVEIRTLEDAVAYAKVDTTQWYVDRWECGGWQTPMKLREFKDGKIVGEQPVKKQLWRVKLYLKRIVPKHINDAIELFFERIAGRAPKFPSIVRRVPAIPHMLEVDLFDAHFGKLAWGPETGGQDYDLKIAEGIYRNAVRDLLDRTAAYEIEKIVIPFGNDFMHFDNLRSETTKGTRVDCDGRYAKVYSACIAATTWAIELALSTAPVEVILVPGNHDALTSYTLARELAAYFRNCSDVKVDFGPAPRKFLRYGTCLIGYTHGDEESHKDLTGILAVERPHDWAATTCREWRLGHWHKSKAKESVSIDSHLGVVSRWMQSLSATDAWHYRKAFIGTRRAAEAYLMSRDEGYTGHFVAYARTT